MLFKSFKDHKLGKNMVRFFHRDGRLQNFYKKKCKIIACDINEFRRSVLGMGLGMRQLMELL